MSEQIQFRHFYGTLSDWRIKIESLIWDDSVVFGHVWDEEEEQWEYKIFAGAAKKNDRRIIYSYDAVSEEEIDKIRKDLNGIMDDMGILLDGQHAEKSIQQMIDDSLETFILPPDRFLLVVDNEKSTVKVSIDQDSSLLVFTAPISDVRIDVGTTSPEEAHLRLHNGDYYVKEEVITEKPGAEPRRTAYIYNASTSAWQVLDGNVDATNVYFNDGICRTAAIGVLEATEAGEIVNEGKAMNLKELLEYYLVKEVFPEPESITGTGEFDDFGMVVNGLPQNIKNYITINGHAAPASGSLVEIGSQMTVGDIQCLLECVTHGEEQTSLNCNPAKVNGLTFGYCTELGEEEPDGHYKPAGTISRNTCITGEVVACSAEYHIKDTNLNVIATLSVQGRTQVSDSSNSEIILDSSTTTVAPGVNTVTLSVVHDASMTRTFGDTEIPGIDHVYVISNKDHVDAETMIDASAGEFTGTTSCEINQYAPTTYKVTGVYPIFTNGNYISTSSSSAVQPPQLKDTSTGWYNNTQSGESIAKLTTLVDYTTANRLYSLTFGASDSDVAAYIYVPKGMSFSVPYVAMYNEDRSFNAWSENHTRAAEWVKEKTETIEIHGAEVEYDVYKDNTDAGKCAFLVLINRN